MTQQAWTEADTIAADDLYLRLGSKRLRATGPEVVALAEQPGRTPTAVAAQIDNLQPQQPRLARQRDGPQGGRLCSQAAR